MTEHKKTTNATNLEAVLFGPSQFLHIRFLGLVLQLWSAKFPKRHNQIIIIIVLYVCSISTIVQVLFLCFYSDLHS